MIPVIAKHQTITAPDGRSKIAENAKPERYATAPIKYPPSNFLDSGQLRTASAGMIRLENTK